MQVWLMGSPAEHAVVAGTTPAELADRSSNVSKARHPLRRSRLPNPERDVTAPGLHAERRVRREPTSHFSRSADHLSPCSARTPEARAFT
ncbi:hypothetical protein GCM10023335_52310 [Streptomyces siamensis]|uniref:Uncharacterized protein n=1 Tax=Streptomyces siamensis TaxID=1274986 RepID=A0ABP9J850_9ACTN